MEQRRTHFRVPVNLPVSCTFVDSHYRSMLSLGEICDLSLGGIRINVPVKPFSLKSTIVDYSMILPRPFPHIRGFGQIKWDLWDEKKERMTMGLQFIAMNQTQQKDLAHIVEEAYFL